MGAGSSTDIGSSETSTTVEVSQDKEYRLNFDHNTTVQLLLITLAIIAILYGANAIR